MNANPIISISGIRGIFGESLRPDNIVKYVSSFSEFSKNDRIVIGRDGRVNGGIIEKIVESVLLFKGCEVINLGMAPTPTIALAVETLKASGGIAITASHNPQQWNGLKFINSKGIFLNADEFKILSKLFESDSMNYITWDKVRPVEHYPDFYHFHISRVLNISYVDVHEIRKRKFKVVVDCINSSGSFIVPELLSELGCEIIKVDCDGRGIFTRLAEPLPENLAYTALKVTAVKADLGIVVDPDADRLVIITEKGEPFIEENTIVTVIKRVLCEKNQNNKNVVVNLSTTRAVDDIVKSLKGKLYRAPVGEINVIQKMKKVNAVVGGEGSGGVILPEVHYGRDSLVGIPLILSEIAESGLKVSEYKENLPYYYISKTKFEVRNKDTKKIFDKISKAYKQHKINSEDGLRIDMEDCWFNIRKSNTEPIIRIIAEAKTKQKAESLIKEVITKIR